MRNIRLVLAYDGTDFHGWQRQPSAPSIQSCLESTLAKIMGTPVQVLGSGRTDAGVHALHQVASFTTECRIPCKNLLKALNDSLPPTVRVKKAEEVPANFHPRYDARSKTYRYRIYQGPICSPFIWRFVWHYPLALERVRMAKAARLVEGEHDFTSFAASDGSATGQNPEPLPSERPGREHPEGALLEAPGDLVRTVFSSRILWRPRASTIIYEIRGNGFLRHMVRNLVGTLVEVGKGRLAPQDIGRILMGRDRTLAGPTAPARGLCLVHVQY